MDGTILNTIDDLKDCLNHALSRFGFPALSIEEVKLRTGNGIRRLVEESLPKNTDNRVIDEVFDFFKDYYELHCNDKTRPYDGITETLSAIKKKGYSCAVLSNKVHSAVLELCRAHFDGLFDYILGNVEGLKKKPDPDGIERLLFAADVDRSDALLVGDSDIDIQTGYNAKIDVVGAAYGFRDRKVLEKMGVKNIISEPKQLLDLLNI